MLRILLLILWFLPVLVSPMLGLPVGAARADSAPVPEAGPAKPVVMVLGDSLSAAYGLRLNDGWVALLQQRIANLDLPFRVVNAAISGDTVAGGMSRLPALMDEHSPAIVVVELGANDGLRGFPPSQIKEQLTRLVERIQAADAKVLVVGVRLPPNYGSAYTERFQRLFATVAEETGAALVPMLLAGVAEDLSLMQADALHPTAAAQPLILDNVWPVLQPMLEAIARSEAAPG